MTTLPITYVKCPMGKYDIKCPYTMTPKGITVHETYNDASAMNEISYMLRNNYQTSFHYAVDDTRAVQGIPLNRNAWHSGDGRYGDGNRTTIAIECCYSKSGGDKYDKAFDNTLTLVARLMKKYNFTVNDVYYHKSFANKNCPNRALDNGITLGKYRKLVQERYNELYETPEQKHARLVKANAKEYGMKVPTSIKKGQRFWISRYATFYGGAHLGKEIPDKVLKSTDSYTAKKGTLLKQKYKGKTYKFVLAKEINSYIRLDEIMVK